MKDKQEILNGLSSESLASVLGELTSKGPAISQLYLMIGMSAEFSGVTPAELFDLITETLRSRLP